MPPESNVRIPLNHDFRYFHEPVSGNLSEKWAVGRKQLAEEFADRIVLSRGGAFLVGGLRGVGKTTFVRLAMHAIRSAHKRYAGNVGHFELVDVWLNISRALEPGQLLHLLIRHLYLRLKEVGLLYQLDPELQKDLNTAFLRTAFEISSRSLNGEERGSASEFGFGKAPWIGIEFLGKISSSYKRTRSDEEALKYLPYDEKAAEFDILNFARRLQEGIQPKVSFLQRLLRLFRAVPGTVPSIRVVFVLDELDKLENGVVADGTSPLDPILQSLKTVFSASGFSFVFVGGKEVEERMIEDVSHADSIYESIFAYNLYLPCLWEDQGDIFGRCLAPDDSKDAASYQETVKCYLRYKGRGIPRRTWREVNKYVWWDDVGPNLILDSKSRRYMELFARLEEGLQRDDLFTAMGRTADNVRSDRQRLYFYYTADWVLSRGRESFSSLDVVAMAKTLNLGGSLTSAAATRIAGTTIDILYNRAFIEKDLNRTKAALEPDGVYYRLAPWVRVAFEGFAEEEKTAEASVQPDRPGSFDEPIKIGQYQLVEEISSGGYSIVYKVRHTVLGTLRAAKMLRAKFADYGPMVESFNRESDLLRKLDHPGLIQMYESGDYAGRPYFIMDILDGVTLGTLLDNVKMLSVSLACRIAHELAQALGYLHFQGMIHCDIKPGNIFLTREGHVKLLDLGIARRIGDGDADFTGVVLGTPGYMAPEQIVSPKSVGPWTDVYSLAVTLFQMLAGQLPFGLPDDISAWKGLTQDAPSLLSFSFAPPPLAEAVAQAMVTKPEDRTRSMQPFALRLANFAGETADELIAAIDACQTTLTSSQMATMTGFDFKQSSSLPTTMVPPPAFVPSPPAPVGAGKGGGFTRLLNKRPFDRPPTPAPAPAAPAPDKSSVPDVFSSPGGSPSAASPVSAADWISKLWNSNRSGQESAFQQMCASTGTHHLVFDFARDLCLWGGPGAISRSIELRGTRLILGRSASEVDLPLDHASISRQHLALFYGWENKGTVIAEDLSSATGTRLNGSRLSRNGLSDSDKLEVGSNEISIYVLPAGRTLIVG